MHKRAFTLIELLVTIIIIGLLTTVATTSFLTAQRNARDNARKTTLTSISAALEAYKLANNSYPGVVDPSVSSSSGYVSNQRCVINDTYYFNPTATGTNSCPTPAFAPSPNWIPGLGKYLSPVPVEKRYIGSDGLSTSNGSFSSIAAGASTGQPTNQTRTYSYKKTATGYNAFVKIEGSSCPNGICSIAK